MKRNTQLKIFYLLFIAFILTIGNVYGQERTLEKVDDNLYQYILKEDGKIQQKGYYKKINGNYEEHWYWRDYAGTVAYFENGKMLWIKPKGKKKYTYREIEYHRMKAEIKRLKSLVALND